MVLLSVIEVGWRKFGSAILLDRALPKYYYVLVVHVVEAQRLEQHEEVLIHMYICRVSSMVHDMGERKAIARS